MNKPIIFSTGYVAPTMEVYATTVEEGFSLSYGELGEAGDGFDINDNGDF